MTNLEESTGATIATTTATSASTASPDTKSQPTPQQIVEIVHQEVQNSPTRDNELLLVPKLSNDNNDDKNHISSIEHPDNNNDSNTQQEELNQNEELIAPLVQPLIDNTGAISPTTSDVTIRSRKKISHDLDDDDDNENNKSNKHFRILKQRHTDRVRQCCHHAAEIQRNVLRNTITAMNFLARVLFWVSLVALSIGVVWYSRELALHG